MDYYQTLGVPKSASQEDIKKSYRKLARQYHPDVNQGDPGATAKFKEISEAYDTLSDPEKRKHYDSPLRSGGMPDFSDIFGANFGFGSVIFNMQAANLNIEIPCSLTFLEPKSDVRKTVSYTKKVPCKKCNASGALTFKPGNCFACKGSGRTPPRGFLVLEQPCGTCRGKGRLVEQKCQCDDGYTPESTTLEVTIPAGITTNKILRIPNGGHHGPTGVGDLRLMITVGPHPIYTREGPHVISQIELTYPILFKGSTITVDTIWGKESLVIPPKSKPTSKLVIPNAGFPVPGRMLPNERGHHYLIIDIKYPDIRSEEHSNLLQQLQNLYGG